MPQLVFEALWKDRGAQKGVRDLGRTVDTTHKSLERFGSGIARGIGAAAGIVTKFGAGAVLALGAAGGAAVREQAAVMIAAATSMLFIECKRRIWRTAVVFNGSELLK